MKSNVHKEDTDAKKKYVFFSNPDVIVRRAESAAAASQALQNHKIQEQLWHSDPKLTQSEPESSANREIKSELKGLETLLSYHPVQPYPFTFITAVKRKLALSMHAEACKRAYEPEKMENVEAGADVIRTIADSKRSINQVAQKMDFIKPLKVPDLKISPKTIDYSARDSLAPKDVVQPAGSLSSKKFDIHALEDAALASNKSPKSCEKVHRRLDFGLLDGSPIKSCENIEPLKAPDLSIGSSLSKKKEHARDSSREKENRSKRIKKDDAAFGRKEDGLKETPRRSKSSKHQSRRDMDEESNSIFEMFKPEKFLTNAPRESDFGFKKPKSKNFVTSTAKKNDEKKQRSNSVQGTRPARERSSESKNRNYDNESNSEKSMKLHERITTRDGLRAKPNDAVEHGHKMLNQDFDTLRQGDDLKYKNTEPSGSKQQKHSSKFLAQGATKQFDSYSSRTQLKKSYEKQKPSGSEPETKELNSASDISVEIRTAFGSVASSKEAENQGRIDATNETDDSLGNEISLQQLKCSDGSREVEQSSRNSQTSNSQTDKYLENTADANNAEILSMGRETNTDSRTTEDSTNQGDTKTSSSQNKSNSEYKNFQSKSLSGVILDPNRISFRDESLEEQSEFCDLVTPDVNLLPRSKRRKNIPQEEDGENDVRNPNHQTPNAAQTKDKGIKLLNPTALHLQFQAELHLLDSFNESLRQVMDVENSIYTAKHEQDQEFLRKQKENEVRRKNLMLVQTGKDTVDIERYQGNQSRNIQEEAKKGDFTPRRSTEEDEAAVKATNTDNDATGTEPTRMLDRVKPSQNTVGDSDYTLRKNDRIAVRVTEVQTQTANDIATQTETPRVRRRHNSPGRQVPGITYQRGSPPIEEIPQLSLESFDKFEDFDQIENVSLPSRLHTMSEISLHETTSSIRTETGTEISISTRDVTCSFNKYLDSELAQLIKDEKQRYDEIEMLFKSREKTLNDRTKKLVKLEEQKRALRDMGQDSRISSVKKKQRALLLKLQQEKDEMNRLKEMHKKASQERKLMLQKQRNMLNPQMSTKNILTKLKRSADSQSPRRLSGPMKGYDIRSPSSMSSLVDSDKSQLDRSHMETKTSLADVRLHKSEGRNPRSDIIAFSQEGHDKKLLNAGQFENTTEQSDISLIDPNLSPESQKFINKLQRIQNATQKSDAKSKYEAKLCKYKDSMLKIEASHPKAYSTDLESHTVNKKTIKSDGSGSSERSKPKESQQKPGSGDFDKSISENIRSESDTLVDDFSKKSKSSQATEMNFDNLKLKREKETLTEKNIFDAEDMNTESDSIAEELGSKRSKSLQTAEEISELSSKNSKRTQNSSLLGKESCKKSQNTPKTKSNSKRKGSRSVKSKTSSDILSENILRSKSSSQISEEIMKHHSKRSKTENDEIQSEENCQKSSVAENLEANESQSSLQALVEHSRAVKEKNYQLLRNIANEHEAKENISRKDLENLPNVGNMSTRSQVSTLTISHHSSGESEKSYSRSVVIRAQDHHFRTTKKLEQILTAREAALASRRSCVEEWIAWHSRLRAEESRVARMEEAAFKLVSAASNALPYHDTTVSSDTSDVESRIEVLAEKLAERRNEMARLKREAKRQAKQRLKALETNLLNQIKKYDTTIHKMRKKLETKRGALFNDSSSEKLAIESRSLTDFKIPDIPINRIKEIYKNSDLLKSRSESELRSLISESNERKEFDDVYRNEVSERNDTSNRKSLRSPVSDVTDRSEVSNSDKKATTQSIQSIFEDVKTTSSKEVEFISERIESESVSEQIEAQNYTSKSLSDKSEDGISNISSKSESDHGANEIENSHSRGIGNDIEISSVLSGTKASMLSGASRASSNYESQSVLENIQTAGSVEVESETIDTVPESNLLRSTDISVQESISKFVPSEVISERKSSSANAISDGNKDEEITRSVTHESTSPKTLSPKTNDLGIQSDGSASEIQKTLPDTASATGPFSAVDELDIGNSVQTSPSISNKLSFLELGNKNLNDDISTLENDLKALSEMMSQFSKKSDGKLRSEIVSKNEDKPSNATATDSEKETSEDITDLDYPNDAGDRENGVNSDHNATYIVEEEPDNSESNEKNLTAQVTEIMLKIMPENATPSPDSNREMDYKARSREILNEIEKSIISEHARSPESAVNNLKSIATNISGLKGENEKAVDNLDSLENDIMSIAEIISHASEAKKDIRIIEKFGHDTLFDEEEPVQASPISPAQTSQEPVILLRPSKKDSFDVPSWNMPVDSNEEDPSQATDELKESLESLKKNLEDINIQNVARNLTEAPSTTFEPTEIMFETIKDPEYEDISEESMEVSEIMDRSESQRSDKQFYQKSSRLPEKYQMTQKSEDVLRILDEISQKTNDGSVRSQQILLTPGNHGRKIDELLQRSEKLSRNFENLTRKPSQLDVALNAPTAIYQKPAESLVLQNQTPSQHSQKSLADAGRPQPTSMDSSSRKAEEQKSADVILENEALNFSSKSSESPIALSESVTSMAEAPEKSDPLSQHSDIARRNVNQVVQKSDTLNEELVDKLYKSDKNLQGSENESEVLDSKMLDAGIPVFGENSTTTDFGEEESVDKASPKSMNQSEKPEDVIEADGTGILSDKINAITEISEYQEVHEVSQDESIRSEASNEEIVSGSDKELDKSNGYSYNVEVQIHDAQTTSPSPSSEKSSLQKFEEEAPESGRIVAESGSLASTPEVVSQDRIESLDKPDESDVKHRHMGDKIQSFDHVLHKIKDTQDLTHEINAADKSLDCVSQKSDESQGSDKSEDILQKYEVEPPSESSEDIETPRSVSEIEIDSPRDPNDSRLDIDNLDDDLLANENNVEVKPEFHAAPVVATSEKDIEAMIDKLKVSLEQPGLDVAELEAKLLRIQQLQIELEIKKLEAEEVSYYVREIPNKPPPPYTPPSGGRLSVSQTSPSPAPAVVPANVEDLTLFTERATHLIYQAKQSGDDIVNLEPPIEICELSKDNNETSRRDRKIYNTFLFDLCKETISEVYQSEYEKPGPSWLKPNAKTKPTMKIPKTVDGLNDYVSKEVATLFGFKTKLQRENLVMRWSRKRRDRVDELLAREAQAEEDEWTKFHHDELAVKNELTTAILDSLILDAASVVKLAYLKKRRIPS